MRPAVHRLVGAVTVAVLVVVALGVAAEVPAGAHPFGPPTTASLVATDRELVVRLAIAPDDLQLLGGALGVLPNRRSVVVAAGADGEPDAAGSDDASRLAASPALAAYLQDHVRLLQHGAPCVAQVDVGGLSTTGAEVRFTCPDVVTEVDLEVTVLTDLHEAYRTVVVGPAGAEPGRTLHTRADGVHTWRFGGSPAADGAGTGRRAALVAVPLGAGAAATSWWARRRVAATPTTPA